MSYHNIISPNEVPEESWSAYGFNTQTFEFFHGSKYKMTVIERTCMDCGKKEKILANTLRMAIRYGYHTGLCRKCGRERSYREAAVRSSQDRLQNPKKSSEGYVLIRRNQAQNGYRKDKNILEHRFVMEQHLGRPLLPTETVHHKNGIKTDNRIENLELWSSRHVGGQRYEDLDEEQIEILIEHLQGVLREKRAYLLPFYYDGRSKEAIL